MYFQENIYHTRSDFHNSYEYSVYVAANIQIGSWVRCCAQYEEVQEGEIGVVEEVIDLLEVITCFHINRPDEFFEFLFY